MARLADQLQEPVAVGPRHAHVYQSDVHRMLPQFVERLLAVLGFGHNLNLRTGKRHTKSLANEVVIVGNQQSKLHGAGV